MRATRVLSRRHLLTGAAAAAMVLVQGHWTDPVYFITAIMAFNVLTLAYSLYSSWRPKDS